MHSNKYSSNVIRTHRACKFVKADYWKEVVDSRTSFVAVAGLFTKDVHKKLIAAEERHLEKENKDGNENRVIEDEFHINS